MELRWEALLLSDSDGQVLSALEMGVGLEKDLKRTFFFLCQEQVIHYNDWL